ncbi:sigma-70 family RNA polymerase sigma factor [Streptomyces sp. Vc74B-19]|uniref:sigma-70 family RNA polymerase sigma factor n=1 Tax=Streptomyces sp. Vc74B-19 TaxID=2741324 RepID=UPI001BFC00BD|nr:sigma-70 family RNA polymerase sigma factor [Streptomyces sp. Vc74B-19]MBT3165657.1 sigma-70 family RNA polymerase sigma factor [Streptomyces sp. Vc74B-19]
MAASTGPGGGRGGDPSRGTVEAARRGDQRAQDELVAACLPLVYNVVGRALNGHPDVDDVVQETMLRVLGSLGSLDDPARFRSWLVAVTMNQLRHHWRDHRTEPPRSGLHDARELADPGADFVDLTIVRLGLEGQRREVAEATRWLNPDDQALLSLWWLEAAGELTRAEVAAALELSPQHAAVRVQRMKAQLETARLVVRALSARPRCVLLDDVVAGWDLTPSALWRKRIARHARDCTVCAGFQSGLVPAEGLLVGLGLVPVGAGLLAATAVLTAFGTGTAEASPAAFAAQPTATPGPDGTAVPWPPSSADGPSMSWPEAPSDGPMTSWPQGWADGAAKSGERGDGAAEPGEWGDGAAGPGDGAGEVIEGRSVTARGAESSRDGGAPGPVEGHGAPGATDRVAGPRTSRRTRSRERRRRGQAVAVAALLVVGGVISGVVILTPDDGADQVRTAPTSVPVSAAPTAGASAPTGATATASRTTEASPSAGTSRTPKPSATPRPTKSEARPSPARTTSTPPPQQAEPKREPDPPAPPAGPAAQVLALTNAQRAQAGCAPVKLDDRLGRAAQAHSEDMSANGYFSHTGRDGSTFVDRARAQGHPSPGAENIARGQGSAASVMDAWMNSPGHRANILNCSLTSLGVGVVSSDWTWTQVFGY